MKKISVAVCDTDQAYGKKLGEWISLEKGERLRGCSFSGPEGFLEFRKEQKTEIVLLGTGFWEDVRILEQIKEPGKEEGEEEPENLQGDTVWIYCVAVAQET